MVKVSLVLEDRAAICRSVLGSLPDWFGIASARKAYVRHAAEAPMLGAEVDGKIVGFASLADHFGRNCEIHSMGVRPECHRQGVGRALVEATVLWAGEQGFGHVSVKTLSEAHADPHYARTRAFYRAMGFQPFEEFPTLWGRDNPCLMLVRRIGK